MSGRANVTLASGRTVTDLGQLMLPKGLPEGYYFFEYQVSAR